MKFVVSGGGTAGHINPALALAEELERRGHELVFAGTPKSLEERLATQAGLEFKAFEAQGFNRSHPKTLITAVKKIARSSHEACEWFDQIQPDAVIGFGGYVSIPVGRAASKKHIPLIVHEQNSIMGLANKQLSKKAQAVALTYEAAASSCPCKDKISVTGNPVRSSVVAANRAAGRELLGVPEDARMLLVFGGSLGAQHINNALVDNKDMLLALDDLYIVHITGPKEFDRVNDALALSPEQEKRWKLISYQDRMGDTLAAADLVVSRAGATSLAEISALGIPAILVPFPFATADHQSSNARSVVERGAAYLIADEKVQSPEFTELLARLLEDEEERARMTTAAKSFETVNAATRLADLVCAIVENNKIHA